MPIAKNAGIRQIAKTGGTTVLATNHVIDLVLKNCVVLMDEAVFATVPSSTSYCRSELVTNITGHVIAVNGLLLWPFSEYVLAQQNDPVPLFLREASL